MKPDNELSHVRVQRIGGNGTLHCHIRRGSGGGALSGWTIVFVHGFIGDGVENHRLFIRLSDSLRQIGATCLLFDQFGTGYSDGEYSMVTLDECRRDIQSVLRVAREFSDRVILVGQSLGSALLLTMADHSQNWSGRVLLNPVERFQHWLLDRYDWQRPLDDLLCARPKGFYVSAKFVNELLQWSWLDALEPQACPTLIVSSSADEIGGHDVARSAVEKLGRHAQLAVIRGANHTFMCQKELETQAIDKIVAWTTVLAQHRGLVSNPGRLA